MKIMKLSKEEKELLKSYENGEMKSVKILIRKRMNILMPQKIRLRKIKELIYA